MRGADRLIAALEREGVDCVFGLPGGASLPIHDALHDSAIRHVLVRHEAGAGHAAEGYAKASGRVGVALVTSGPGATNLVDADRRRAHGLGPDRVHQRPGAQRPAGHERLPGDRRARHDAADRQALDRGRAPRRRRARRSTRRSTSPARGGRGRCSSTSRATMRAPRPARAPARRRCPGYRTRVRAQRAPAAQRPRRRSRRRGGRCSTRAAASCTPRPRPSCGARAARRPAGDDDADGARRVPRVRPPLARDARHARDARGELGDGRGRPDRRGRRALRRPRDRRRSRRSPARAKIVHIDVDAAEIGKNVEAHIPIVGDARPGAGRLHAHARRAGARPGAARATGGRGSAAGAPRTRPASAEHADGAIDAEAALDALQAATARRGDRHHRRRPAPDVGGQPAALRPPAALADLRRPGHDGLRPARRARARRPRSRPRQVVCVTGDGSLLMNVAGARDRRRRRSCR